MAYILIWGETRDILPGNLSASLRTEEVRSLAGLQAAIDGKKSALVVADPSLLEAEQAATETWLRNGGSDKVAIVAVADAADGDAVLGRFPFVDDVLLRPVTPVRLRHKLERAVESLGRRSAIRQLERAYTRRGEELSQLNDIGVKLSAERDINKLLELILQKSREITVADAGSLYLVEPAQNGNGGVDRLRFMLPQNDSVAVSDFQEHTIPLDETSIAGYVALTGEPVNVADAYHLPEGSPYTISRSFDEKSGYRSRSMLVVPMKDHKEVVIGVVQLINKKRDAGAVLQSASLVDDQVISFTAVDRDLVESLASQAAVAFENADLIQRIRTLFDEFIHRAVAAVELRDPTTAGHSERVAVLTVGLVEKVDAVGVGPLANARFTRDQVEEVRYAALLHDFGKVAVQEKYLRKGKKLYATQMIAIRQRFAYILRSIEADRLRARLQALESGRTGTEHLAAIDAECTRRRTEAERVLQVVLSANEPTVVEEDSFRAVMNLPRRDPFANHEAEDRFPVEAWAEGPFLTADEVESLSIRKGSLSEDERQRIESHVSHTYEFLQKLPWTGEFRRIPEIAWAHHEKLDGSGYPRGLKAPDIPIQSRMMTIADIYDALVAWDRPYKPAQSVERALGILKAEAQGGKLDTDLLAVFLEAKLYELPEFKIRLQRKSGP
jgi:HD-GYP domain-containing protein (c-di-GMP phosphodiesterase class II)